MTQTLSCPSCNPSGEVPHGPSAVPLLASSQAGRQEAQPQPFYLADSGRLYFDSQDALSPYDTNGNVEDVYRYLPSGVEGCGRQAGCVALISAGRGPYDSNFLATEPEGKNAFFTTRDRLVSSDRDDLFDVYDARRGGGFASESEGEREECQGEGCQPTPATPTPTPPGTSSFQGPGNPQKPTTKPCPKGKHQVKVKGKKKCVPDKKKGSKKKRAARHRGAGR
jgi:hypothetical protein